MIFLVLLTFFSCTSRGKKEKSTVFYDINGLVDEQIKLLSITSPSVSKQAIINGNNELNNIEPEDSTAWARELIIFKSVDINRPTLLDSYDVSSSPGPGTSTISCTSKYPEKTEIERLTIELDTHQKPVKIKAILNNQNELFRSAKTLQLTFKDFNGQKLISSYKIEGWQKMVSKDCTSYSIDSKILF